MSKNPEALKRKKLSRKTRYELNHLFETEGKPLCSLSVFGREGETPYKWNIQFVSIEEWQGHALLGIANKEEKTVSKLIREALQQYLERKIQASI